MTMRVGFTGTQGRPKPEQQMSLYGLLHSLNIKQDLIYLHHGDCIGADELAHDLALSLGYRVVIHPPQDPSKRAFCEGAYGTREPKYYLDRNQAIVDECRVLIAVPKTQELIRSGTWATVRRARKAKKPIYVILPSGVVEYDNKE